MFYIYNEYDATIMQISTSQSFQSLKITDIAKCDYNKTVNYSNQNYNSQQK